MCCECRRNKQCRRKVSLRDTRVTNPRERDTGSTTDIKRRVKEHQTGRGAILTRKHLPVKLVYYEECEGFEDAFLREKQVQGWSRKKKEALINGRMEELPELSRKPL